MFLCQAVHIKWFHCICFQDANTVCVLQDVPLKKALKVGSVSGNLHNEYLGIDTEVALYKAVEVQNQNLTLELHCLQRRR